MPCLPPRRPKQCRDCWKRAVKGREPSSSQSIRTREAVDQTFLKDTSKDGYLLSGLTFNKYGDRSNAIGKRFGRLKSSLGYGSDLVFHSFRRGVATQFENKGVPEVIAARVLGHEFPTMSFGTYSGGADLETLKGAIEVLNWS